MIVIVAALGLRSALLVGLAVPGSFLAGILVLGMLGLTVNIVVLFALILAVGMLVDGAIIVVEYADRKMAEGMHRREAYRLAAQRMAWPIIASTATDARRLPAAAVLAGHRRRVHEVSCRSRCSRRCIASLLMALVFVPAIGALVGKRRGERPARPCGCCRAAEQRRPRPSCGGSTGALRPPAAAAAAPPGRCSPPRSSSRSATGRGLRRLRPGRRVLPRRRARAGAGPDPRPRRSVGARARRAGARGRAAHAAASTGIDTVYARSGVRFRGKDVDEDVIGIMLLEFADWRARRPAAQILAEIRERTARPRRHPGRDAQGRGRAAGRQAGPAPARRAPRPASWSRWSDEVRGLLRPAGRPARRHRQPAGARHRVALQGRPRAGRPVRRRHRLGRHATSSW